MPNPIERPGTGANSTLHAALEQNPRYIVHSGWQSRRLDATRDLYVYLPDAYLSMPQAAFPIVLMHDGQNLFDGRLSYIEGHTWNAGGTADRLASAGQMRPCILVGIANSGMTRLLEYTPDPDPVMGGGGGRRYVDAIVRDLLPWLKERYRIQEGAANTAIAGSSLGGLISLYAGLQWPSVFGAVGALSPSLWWNRRSFFRFLESLPALEKRPRIWLDMGTLEGLEHLRDTANFARTLELAGWVRQRDLTYKSIRGGRHTEDAWAARLASVLHFLMPPVPPEI